MSDHIRSISGALHMKSTSEASTVARGAWRAPLGVLSLSMAYCAVALAAGEVERVLVDPRPATPTRYTVEGQTYTWGMGNNEVMTALVVNGERHDYADAISRVELRLDDIAGVTSGNPCGVMVERLDDQGFTLAADYPGDGSGTGNCDMAELLASRTINRGAVDLFSNIEPDAKNVERADFIFDSGLLAPIDGAAVDRAGHAVGEKRGNNPLQMAAILELDVFGQPSRYGPLVRVNPVGCEAGAICYGETDLEHDYAFLQNSFLSPQGFPTVTELSNEFVTMAFVSTEALGLQNAQRYYGFSLFADDVDASLHVLTDPATFPDDTYDTSSGVFGDDADVYGGLAGYFLADSLSIASGQVFLDDDGNGAFNEGDAGIGGIGIVVYLDVDGDGMLDPSVDVPLHDPIDSGPDGAFQLPGLADGDYLVVIDETDPDIPGGLVVAEGDNPAPISIGLNDADDVNFAFVDAQSPAGGEDGGADSGSGADDAGADDSGADDAGASDAGASDAGASDAGAGDAGAGDAGASDAGASDAGASDAGASDSGTDDAGATDAGATDAGATDAGADDSGSTDGGDPATGPDFQDESVTAAVGDSYVINQGDTLVAPVLDNDTDAVGDGLTIVSVGDSPNATIEIVGDTIVYTPNEGFYGDDSFVYTVEDADGTQASGTVTVEVERYSDINNNGLNDFSECEASGVNCGDLRLETGVHGSGLGALSWQTLFALLLLVSAYATSRGLRTSRALAVSERAL